MIDTVIGWFKITQYDDKKRYQSRTKLRLRGFIDILDQQKSLMTKYHN